MSLSFGRRLKEAKKLVQNDAVKKYVINEKSERWIVVGNSCDYLNLKTPIWCRCYAFQQGLYDDPFFQCKHSLAVKLAKINLRNFIYLKRNLIFLEKSGYSNHFSSEN
ncbi:MAG: hypothetical protein ACXADW_15395 [Candidatus Hodarchaeales archaeon]